MIYKNDKKASFDSNVFALLANLHIMHLKSLRFFATKVIEFLWSGEFSDSLAVKSYSTINYFNAG